MAFALFIVADRGLIIGGMTVWNVIWEKALYCSVLVTLILGIMIWVQRILNSRKAGIHEILGVVNLYIWIGCTFAFLYTLLAAINHDAFHASQFSNHVSASPSAAELKQDLQLMLYYSFVTQTTLGFGDVLPVSHFAKALTLTQAVIGQFYLAIVLAHMMNLWIVTLGSQLKRGEGRAG